MNFSKSENFIGWLLVAAYLAFVVMFVAVMAMLPARAETSLGQYILEWRFVTVAGNGPVAGRTPERGSFIDAADCAAFGTLHIGRMHDWVRGLIRADWNHPVSIAFDCKPVREAQHNGKVDL